MNITIKEENNIVTVNVKLSKKDLKEGKITYGSRDAEVELMNQGYNTKKLKIVSQQRAHALMKEKEGIFIYKITPEEPKKTLKKETKKPSPKKRNTPNKTSKIKTTGK